MKKKKKENLAYKLEDKSSQSLPQSQSPKVIKNLLLYPGLDASSSCSVPFSPLLVQILLGENVTVCHFISTSFGVSSIQSLLTNCFVLNKLYY